MIEISDKLHYMIKPLKQRNRIQKGDYEYSDDPFLERYMKSKVKKLQENGIKVSFIKEIQYGTQIKVKRKNESGIITIHISNKKNISHQYNIPNDLTKECLSIFEDDRDYSERYKVFFK